MTPPMTAAPGMVEVVARVIEPNAFDAQFVHPEGCPDCDLGAELENLLEETSVLVASVLECQDCGHETVAYSAPFVKLSVRFACVKCGSLNTERFCNAPISPVRF